MQDPLVAFAGPPLHRSALEIRVNFGIVTGRAATPAEVDALARSLLPHVQAVSIVSEQRYEIGPGHEASVHQVRVEVDESDLPQDEAELEAVTRRLVEQAGRWAEECAAERHAEY